MEALVWVLARLILDVIEMCKECCNYKNKTKYCPFCGKRVTKINSGHNHHSFVPDSNEFYKNGTRCKRCGQKTIQTINGIRDEYCSFCGYKDRDENAYHLLFNALWYARNGQSSSFEVKDYSSGKSIDELKVIYEVAKSNYSKVCDSNQHLQFNISYILITLGVMITLMVSSIFDIGSNLYYIISIPLFILILSLYLSITSIFSRTKLCNTACVEDLRNMNNTEIYNDLINVYEYLTEDVRWYWKCRSTLALWSKRLLLIGIISYVILILLL